MARVSLSSTVTARMLLIRRGTVVDLFSGGRQLVGAEINPPKGTQFSRRCVVVMRAAADRLAPDAENELERFGWWLEPPTKALLYCNICRWLPSWF